MENDTNSVTVELSSVVVPSAHAEAYENELRSQLLPNYKSAHGLISLQVLRRSLSDGWVEVVIVSSWLSGRALCEFVAHRWITERSASENGIVKLGARAYEVIGP
jgi:heme-degrading monooxygenase HmoA